MNRGNLVTNWVPWQPGGKQFEELSQFETLLLIAHFHKYKMYPWKHEKWSQICMKLEKREGGWNEQDRKGEREKVLVTKERSSRGCVISTTHQRREILGSVVSFSLENILICAAAKFTETASIYKKKKNSKRRRWWRGKNTASREDFECAVSQWFDFSPPRALH